MRCAGTTEKGDCSVALGDVMAQQPQQRRLAAAILVLLLLSLCCLARIDAAASAAAASTDRKDDGAATALDKAAGQEAAHGFTVTSVEEQGRGRGPVRVAVEIDMEDYAGYGPNWRHNPQAPHP